MNKKLFDEGVQLEKAGELEDAAVAYQRVVDADPGSQEAVGRLVVVYRKLKEYRKELRVIDAALGAMEQRDKVAQEKWIKAHPGAARLGKEVLRTLGGESMTAYGTDPMVEKLLRRKAVLEKKVGGKPPAARGKKGGARAAAGKKGGTRPAAGKKVETRAAAAAGNTRKKAREKKMEALAREREAQKAARAREKEEKARAKAAEAQARREKAEAKRAAAQAKAAEAQAKAQARQAAAREKEENAHPSLFVVSLRYLVPLEKIDAVMEKHVAFLDKHFAAGDFLMSGRQVPRTGGIIIARGKDRAAIERIMKQDPFVKGKLSSVDIVEFVASKVDKRMKGWL